MEAFLHDDNGRSLDAFLMAKQSCQFNRRFVGFRSGITKEYIPHSGQLYQSISKFFLQAYFIKIRGMNEFRSLLTEGFNELRVTMAEAADRHASYGVEVALAIAIP